ncbi:hypothetical protein EOM89_11620 [Candidatus Falkowbacteria bacterium]|nr:hypothetical protein [Candidatus Falkowbacteria bacterium]
MDRKQLPAGSVWFDTIRHRGKFNTLFFDGHVTTMTLDMVPPGANSAEIAASSTCAGAIRPAATSSARRRAARTSSSRPP